MMEEDILNYSPTVMQSAAFHYQQVKKTTFYLFFRFDTSTVSLMENKKWRAQEGIFI